MKETTPFADLAIEASLAAHLMGVRSTRVFAFPLSSAISKQEKG